MDRLDVEYVNSCIEKSNLILKKYKLLVKNNYSILSEKSKNVTAELIEHLKSNYSFSEEMLKEVVNQYRTDKAIISQLGGRDISYYIANCIENYLNG